MHCVQFSFQFMPVTKFSSIQSECDYEPELVLMTGKYRIKQMHLKYIEIPHLRHFLYLFLQPFLIS